MDWINPTGVSKVHSLIDKVYQRKNLEVAWEMVKANRGSGGVDGQSLEAFASQLNLQLDRMQRELKEDTYRPQPARQHPIQKRDKPGEYRMLGIPTVYDRVCQQALLQRLEPIFEPVLDEASSVSRNLVICWLKSTAWLSTENAITCSSAYSMTPAPASRNCWI